MQTSSLRRQMKNMVNNYTEAEIKVREATSNDHWGPPSSLMSEIADLTFNVVAFTEVMGMIWKRLNDHGKNWRHVYKALTLLDYLIKTGSERVVQECRENIHSIQTLRDFQYIDRDGRDQGINVREKSKQLVILLRDEEKLKKERSQAIKTKTRMSGVSSSVGSRSTPPPYPGRRGSAGVHGDDVRRCRDSPSSHHTSSSSSRLAPELEQARPATSGEEELQLQLALVISREESEKPVQRAPVALDMDEETQLQLALNLSKEEHQQTSFMDLVDVFAVPAEVPPPEHHWGNASHQAVGGVTHPWDSIGSTRDDVAWMAPPPSRSPPPPWEPPTDPWDGPPNNAPGASEHVWSLSNTAFSRVDPFLDQSDRTALQGAAKEHFPRTGSPSDGDFFDEAMDGGQMNVNGRGEGSPELFDLSGLGESLEDPSPRKCRTPESFLGPTAASLVNLDSLIPPNAQAKTTNPFLLGPGLGPSTASTTNPFQTEQPKLTLNQMASTSATLAPLNTSLPYSASVPLSMSHQPASLPLSLTHPTQPGLDLPVHLPEPLLPFSSGITQGSQTAQDNANPFL
ncbi:epsin-3 isoform X6 [Cynoglossus semilaevis]|uniref:epsin-3 isoform X6 n=1 Tax=Cynoglossus semilaevis TaxID=244447 RepID=UPI000D629370|nr:epsin-3 isoform X6 [Cynoglossus semilaevis]